MKKILLLIASISIKMSVFAVDPEYHDAMLSNIKSIDTTNKTEDFIALAGTFEQIANVEKEEWLPKYYASYCYIQASFGATDEDKKDLFADKALELCENASKLKPNESEIACIEAFANIAKMSVSPMSRYMTYVGKINELLGKSVSLNPSNPRPLFLQGTMTYNTPEFAGGGKEKALPQLKNALEKFNSFIPENDLAPYWGKSSCEEYLK